MGEYSKAKQSLNDTFGKKDESIWQYLDEAGKKGYRDLSKLKMNNEDSIFSHPIDYPVAAIRANLIGDLRNDLGNVPKFEITPTQSNDQPQFSNWKYLSQETKKPSEIRDAILLNEQKRKALQGSIYTPSSAWKSLSSDGNLPAEIDIYNQLGTLPSMQMPDFNKLKKP